MKNNNSSGFLKIKFQIVNWFLILLNARKKCYTLYFHSFICCLDLTMICNLICRSETHKTIIFKYFSFFFLNFSLNNRINLRFLLKLYVLFQGVLICYLLNICLKQPVCNINLYVIIKHQ